MKPLVVFVALVAGSAHADVSALLSKFREMAKEAGRDPASVPVTIWGAKEDESLLKRDRDVVFAIVAGVD